MLFTLQLFIELHRSRRQNEDLKEEYNRLQESYRELEHLKEQLQSSEISYHSNLTDAQKELELTKTEVEFSTRLWCEIDIKTIRKRIRDVVKFY